MKNRLLNYVNQFFSKGHKRTIEAKKNIIASIGIKGISIAINLALVPMTINYVNPTQYGIWLTLSSIVVWFSYFDIGFGNGLRNKFAEAKATGNFDDAKIYISTTYAFLILIFTGLWILFFVINNFIDWTKILNAPSLMRVELSSLAIIVFSFFCFQMVFKIINTVLTADQKPAKAAFLNLLGQILALILILILIKTTKGSLIYLSLVLGFSPVFIIVVSSIYLYSKNYAFYRPSFKYVKLSYGREILNIGFSFFLIQIAVIVVYETNNLIIAQIGSPKDVTVFNIAYKYLSIAFMSFSIIISPFWSAFTDAFTKKEYTWMKQTVRKLRFISYGLMSTIIILIFFSKYVYSVWIGNFIEIPLNVTISVGVYVAILIVLSANNQILNGIGKIKVQLLTYSFATIFHIPLALFLGKKFGIPGVLTSAILFYTIICLFSIKQVNLLINNKAKGVWNK
ncbi:MATE family efflux transporter [Algibacter sp.]|nr:MATE family efflux transporter [Algibacter sp.]